MSLTIRVATRKSALALTQTRWVIARYREARGDVRFDEVPLVTEGDRVQDRPLYEVGGKGLFVKEIERALLAREADIAVHSMKDLPGTLAEGLAVLAVAPRESPWDWLLTRDGRSLGELARGATVGTTSLRRQIQLREARPDLRFVPLRGNIDTRLKRLDAGEFDAIVLAEAGVRRLGLAVRGVSLEAEVVPAIAQGALAIEGRMATESSEDARMHAIATTLEDTRTRIETDAERAVQRALSADCVTPVGAIARLDEAGSTLELRGFLASSDGARIARASLRGPAREAERLGVAVADELRRRV